MITNDEKREGALRLGIWSFAIFLVCITSIVLHSNKSSNPTDTSPVLSYEEAFDSLCRRAESVNIWSDNLIEINYENKYVTDAEKIQYRRLEHLCNYYHYDRVHLSFHNYETIQWNGKVKQRK